MKHLNLKIKQLRESKGLNQGQMAQLIGLKQAAYSSLEMGKTRFKTEHLDKFIEEFKLPPDFFVSKTDYLVPESSPLAEVNDVSLTYSINSLNYYSAKGRSELSPDNRLQIPGLITPMAIQSYGDFLQPIIYDHNILICDEVGSGWQFKLIFGDLYVLFTTDEIVVKRILQPVKDGVIALHTFDSSIPPIFLKVSAVFKVFKVNSIISEFAQILKIAGINPASKAV